MLKQSFSLNLNIIFLIFSCILFNVAIAQFKPTKAPPNYNSSVFRNLTDIGSYGTGLYIDDYVILTSGIIANAIEDPESIESDLFTEKFSSETLDKIKDNLKSFKNEIRRFKMFNTSNESSIALICTNKKADKKGFRDSLFRPYFSHFQSYNKDGRLIDVFSFDPFKNTSHLTERSTELERNRFSKYLFTSQNSADNTFDFSTFTFGENSLFLNSGANGSPVLYYFRDHNSLNEFYLYGVVSHIENTEQIINNEPTKIIHAVSLAPKTKGREWLDRCLPNICSDDPRKLSRCD